MSDLERKKEISERMQRNHEAHNWMYHEVDRKAVESIARDYGHLIPQERLEAMRELPSKFESRETFDEQFAVRGHELPEEGRVLGYAQGVEEPAHIALDGKEKVNTIYHERLHQASHPGIQDTLGSRLTEGITEDLANEKSYSKNLEQCYPEERAQAKDIREVCGTKAVEKAYFQGDTRELRACLDRELGAPGLERVRDKLNDWPEVT